MRHTAATILRERGLPVPEQLEAAGGSILLRVFCHAHGSNIVLLLAAYDKGKEPSAKRQNTEIARAKQRLTLWKAHQRADGETSAGRRARTGKRKR